MHPMSMHPISSIILWRTLNIYNSNAVVVGELNTPHHQ
jgi:hypothetical protein